MATATKKINPARRRAARGVVDSNPASLAFAISQDNRGDYLWEIVDGDGNGLVRAGGFGSHEDAERAAHYIHDSARLAHFEPRSESTTSGV